MNVEHVTAQDGPFRMIRDNDTKKIILDMTSRDDDESAFFVEAAMSSDGKRLQIRSFASEGYVTDDSREPFNISSPRSVDATDGLKRGNPSQFGVIQRIVNRRRLLAKKQRKKQKAGEIYHIDAEMTLDQPEEDDVVVEVIPPPRCATPLAPQIMANPSPRHDTVVMPPRLRNVSPESNHDARDHSMPVSDDEARPKRINLSAPFLRFDKPYEAERVDKILTEQGQKGNENAASREDRVEKFIGELNTRYPPAVDKESDDQNQEIEFKEETQELHPFLKHDKKKQGDRVNKILIKQRLESRPTVVAKTRKLFRLIEEREGTGVEVQEDSLEERQDKDGQRADCHGGDASRDGNEKVATSFQNLISKIKRERQLDETVVSDKALKPTRAERVPSWSPLRRRRTHNAGEMLQRKEDPPTLHSPTHGEDGEGRCSPNERIDVCSQGESSGNNFVELQETISSLPDVHVSEEEDDMKKFIRTRKVEDPRETASVMTHQTATVERLTRLGIIPDKDLDRLSDIDESSFVDIEYVLSDTTFRRTGWNNGCRRLCISGCIDEEPDSHDNRQMSAFDYLGDLLIHAGMTKGCREDDASVVSSEDDDSRRKKGRSNRRHRHKSSRRNLNEEGRQHSNSSRSSREGTEDNQGRPGPTRSGSRKSLNSNKSGASNRPPLAPSNSKKSVHSGNSGSHHSRPQARRSNSKASLQSKNSGSRSKRSIQSNYSSQDRVTERRSNRSPVTERTKESKEGDLIDYLSDKIMNVSTSVSSEDDLSVEIPNADWVEGR